MARGTRGDRIGVIANSSASADELSFLRESVDGVGLNEATVEATGGTTELGADVAPELVIVLEWAGVAIAGGLMAAIGTDLWGKVKVLVTKYFSRYKIPDPDSQWFYNPVIVVDIQVGGDSKLQIHFPRKNMREQDPRVAALHIFAKSSELVGRCGERPVQRAERRVGHQPPSFSSCIAH